MIKSFNEVFEDVTKLGVKIKTDEYHPIGKYQIIDQGQEAVAGYSDLEDGVFENVPAIVFGDHTRIVKYVDQPFFLGADGVKVLRSRFKDANYRYLYYALKSVKIPNTGYNRHFKWLKEAKIYYPNSEEQSKIVLILDEISSVIEHRQQELQKLDELVKSRFVELFGDPISNPKGWKKDKAESHIDLLSGYPFQSEQYVNDGINICGGLIIMPQKIQWQDCRHWPSVDGYEDYLLAEDDIVMALDRPWISEGFKIAQVDSTHLPALLIQRTARIRGIDVNQQYLFHCFVNGGFDKHSNVTGSLVPHISAKDIRSFEILLPPIKLQKQFAAFVKQVDKSKIAVQKALDEAQLLFDSLMQKYFG